MREKAERSEAIIDRHQNDAAPRQRRAVVNRRTPAAGDISAAVNPHHDRKFLGGGFGGRPDVEIQAIFARLAELESVKAFERVWLRTRRAKLRAGAHAVPGFDRLRRLPTQLADRRRREGNALVGDHVALFADRNAGNRAGRRFHGIGGHATFGNESLRSEESAREESERDEKRQWKRETMAHMLMCLCDEAKKFKVSGTCETIANFGRATPEIFYAPKRGRGKMRLDETYEAASHEPILITGRRATLRAPTRAE